MATSRPWLWLRDRCARYRSALIVAGLALLVMLPAVGHDFVNWDDNRLVQDNAAVTTPEGIFDIWSSLELPRQYPNYPLTLTTYWIEHQLWGLAPAGYHAVNILLHIVNAVLVLVLMRRLGLPEMAALLAAALFAVHPMQVESVAWISERKNVLFTLFALVTMLAYLSYLDTGERRHWAWAMAAFILALLAKTAAVTVPVTLLATIWLRRNRMHWRLALPVAPFILVACVAGLLTTGVESAPREFVPLLERPLLAVNNLAFYLARLVFPVTVVPVHPKWDFHAGGVFLLAPTALLVVLGLLFRYRRTVHPIVWWGMVHFLASLGPFLGLIGFGYHETSFVADRYVYFASLGVFAPLAVGIVRVLARLERRTAVTTCAGYVAVMAIVTLIYVPVWRNSFTLWTYTLRHNPDCGRAHNNLGIVYEQRGEIDRALAHYAYAMEVDPLLGSAPANYAATMARLGDLAKAEALYMRALRIEPHNAHLHYHLACVHGQQERLEDALVHLRIAARLDPDNAEIYNVAGYAHERLGNADTAADLYRKALLHDPDHQVAWRRLAGLTARASEPVVNVETDSLHKP